MTGRVSGLSQLTANMDGVVAELRHESKPAALEQAAKIVDSAKRLAPVLTGVLRASIDILGVDEGPEGVTVTVGAQTNYAGFVEFGTVKMRAQPYMRPALHQAEVEFVPGMRLKLWDKVKVRQP